MDKEVIKRTAIIQACFFLPQIILILSYFAMIGVAFRFHNPFAYPLMGIVLFIVVLPCAFLVAPAKRAFKDAKQNEIVLNIIFAFIVFGIVYGVLKAQSG